MENTLDIKDFVNAKPYDTNSDGTVSCGLLSLSQVQYSTSYVQKVLRLRVLQTNQ